MRILPKALRFFILVIGVFVLNFSAYAGHSCNETGTFEHLCNPSTATMLNQFFTAIVDFLWVYGMPFMVIFLVIAGFMFVTARGNEEQLTKAKAMLFWTIIGAAVIVGAKILVEAIGKFADSLK
ncbi:MAG: hypothetical protein AAB930_02705 [Patescibacteria group bacterium]